MDFELNETQVLFQNMARDFAEREIKPVAMEYDRKANPADCIPVDLIRKGFAQDFHKMIIPEKYGGMGLDALTACLILEELSVGDPGFANTFHASNAAISFLVNYGSEETIKKFISMITDGEGGVGAISTCEPDGGTTSANLAEPENFFFATTGTRDGNDWVLNGNKAFASNIGMPFSKWVMVFARIDMTKVGMMSTGGFMVPTETPGFKLMGEEDKLGLRTSSTWAIKFDNCRVPDSDRLKGGTPMCNYEYGSAIAAMSIGCARAAYEAALDYSKKRMILGKPIIRYELMQAKLADMYIGLEASRSLMYRAASYACTHPVMDYRLGRAVKIFSSETCQKITSDALQMFGGSGFSKGSVVEKAFRDIRIMPIFEGPNEVLRVNLAKQIEAKS